MNGVTMPERSVVQRLHALEKANRVRVTRAEKKREIRQLDPDRARATVAELVIKPPAPIRTMKVHELLLQVPGWGKVKVDRLLMVERVSPSKTVGGLSERQRLALSLKVLGVNGKVAAA